jgi:predicted dehydrogenase
VDAYTCALHGEERTAVASGPTIVELALYSVDAKTTDELKCKHSPYAGYARINANVPPLMELYDEFANKIEGKPSVLPTFEDALVTQKVLAAIGYSLDG